MRSFWFFRVYISTFFAALIVLGSTAFVGYKCISQIDKANELKNTAAEKYEYIPSSSEGISFLLICKNSLENSHNFYALVDYSPQSSLTTAVIPWQLTETVGVKKRSLDGFSEKGSARDVLVAVNTAFDIDVPKYICISDAEFAEAAEIIGGVSCDVEKNICYGGEEKYVDIKAGFQKLSGDMTAGALFEPLNFINSIDGYKRQSELFGKLFSQNFSSLSEESFEKVFKTTVNNSATNIIAEDYEYRKDALVYSAGSDSFSFCVITPEGDFDIKKDSFSPSERFSSQIKAVFPSSSE